MDYGLQRKGHAYLFILNLIKFLESLKNVFSPNNDLSIEAIALTELLPHKFYFLNLDIISKQLLVSKNMVNNKMLIYLTRTFRAVTNSG